MAEPAAVPGHDADARAAQDAVRRSCRGLPGVTERTSHGNPAFFAGQRWFLMMLDDHHGDGRLALWYAAPPGVQAELVEQDPERFFVPPYVGHRGWLGARLDLLSAGERDAICREAWSCVVPATGRGRLSR